MFHWTYLWSNFTLTYQILSKKVKDFVLMRAGFLCEYCLSPSAYSIQPFTNDHITPSSKKGTDDLDNLASACGGCNGHKYNKTKARDPLTGKIVPLFNPRKMNWYVHFEWSINYLYVTGITDIGRATVEALYLNREGVLNTRRFITQHLVN